MNSAQYEINSKRFKTKLGTLAKNDGAVPTYNDGKTDPKDYVYKVPTGGWIEYERVDIDQQNSLHTDDESYVNHHTLDNCPRIALGERCPYVHELVDPDPVQPKPLEQEIDEAVLKAIIDETKDIVRLLETNCAAYTEKDAVVLLKRRINRLIAIQTKKKPISSSVENGLDQEIDDFLAWVMANRDVHSSRWADEVEPVLKRKIKALLTKERQKEYSRGFDDGEKLGYGVGRTSEAKERERAKEELEQHWYHEGFDHGHDVALADAKLWAYHHFGVFPHSSFWSSFGDFDEPEAYKRLKK